MSLGLFETLYVFRCQFAIPLNIRMARRVKLLEKLSAVVIIIVTLCADTNEVFYVQVRKKKKKIQVNVLGRICGIRKLKRKLQL